MVQDSTNYGIQYKDGALRETPLAVSQAVTSNRYIASLWLWNRYWNIGMDWTEGTIPKVVS